MKFVMLSKLTDEGMETLKKNPNRLKEVNQEVAEKFGVKIVDQYALMGTYDFVNILDAPDNDTMVKMATELGSRGTIRTLTMPAIEIDRFIQDIGSLAA
ncbi:MAG TPA: GYD domain-containing protein [Candidatus Aquicultor sp.]